MTNSNHTRPPDDDPQNERDRIDANPPYGSSPEQIKHFREFLAEMIARQLLAERQRKPAPGDDRH